MQQLVWREPSRRAARHHGIIGFKSHEFRQNCAIWAAEMLMRAKWRN
jgi:hypothetical protein